MRQVRGILVKRFLAVCFLAACLLLGRLISLPHLNAGEPSSSPAGGQTLKLKKLRNLKLRWSVGFGKSGSSCMRDSWVPVHLLITNETKKIFQGHVVYTVTDQRIGNRYVVTYESPEIVLSKSVGSFYPQKHIVNYVYLPKNPGTAQIEARLVSTTHASVFLGSKTLRPSNWGRYDPRYRQLGKQQILLLVAKGLNLNLPDSAGSYLQGKRHWRNWTTNGSRDFLPHHWVGYSGVSTIVWDGMDLTRNFQASAQNALLNYVAAGGHLLIAVGDKPSRILNSCLHKLLPCTLGEQSETDVGGLWLRRPGLQPTLLTVLTPHPNTWVYTDRLAWVPMQDTKKIPLAVRGDYGAGSVTVLAFSLAARFLKQLRYGERQRNRQDATAYSRWRQISGDLVHRAHDPLQAQASQNLRQKARLYLNEAATIPLPSKREIATLLVIYLLILVPLTYVVFRKWSQLEYAWLVTPVIAVGFLVWNYSAAFSHLEKALAINEICLLRLDDKGLGGVYSQALLHNPIYAKYNLSYREKRIAPLYLRMDRIGDSLGLNETHQLKINEEKGGFSLADFAIAINSTRPLEYSGVVQMGKGLQIKLNATLRRRLTPDASGTLGKINNQLGINIWHAALIKGSQAVLLEPILANKEQTLTIKHGWEDRKLTADQALAEMCEAAGHALLRKFAGVGLNILAGQDGQIYLVAIMQTAPAVWRINGKAGDMRRSLTILAQPCHLPSAPPVVTVPPYVRDDLEGDDGFEDDDDSSN